MENDVKSVHCLGPRVLFPSERVFRQLFASEFERVRRASVESLLERSRSTVGDVERTIKQLRFTAVSENVARKVQGVHYC